MFIKKSYSTKRKKIVPYYQVVESYRERDSGKIKHKVLSNLGHLSEKQIDKLVISLNKQRTKPYHLSYVNHEDQYSWGDVYFLSSLWDKLGIGALIKKFLKNKKTSFDISKAALLMVLNRCIVPKSKLSLYEWQDRIYFSDKFKYHQVLRTLGYLERIKDSVEEGLFAKHFNLFNQKVDLVFYDVTSTYFEGEGPKIAKKGYSSDSQPSKNQIILALAVTKDGIPIGHEVYEGNRKGSTTVVDTIERLNKRFGVDKCIFVGDRGIVSQDNIDKLNELHYEYIFALRKRRLIETREVISEDLSKYSKIKINENGEIIKLYYLEIKKGDLRYVVCHNPIVAAEELIRLEERLGKKEKQVKEIISRFKDPSIVIKHISQIYDINRYVTFGIKKGNVYYRINSESVEYEKLIAGKWVIKTTNMTLSATELIEAYKNLSAVESAFKNIKSFIKIRPMFHRDEDRVRGHVFICVLAYYLQKIIDLKLKKNLKEYSAIRAIEKLGQIKMIKNRLGETVFYQSVQPKKEHNMILDACDIPNIPKTVFKEH